MIVGPADDLFRPGLVPYTQYVSDARWRHQGAKF